jgi:hypothetical protein
VHLTEALGVYPTPLPATVPLHDYISINMLQSGSPRRSISVEGSDEYHDGAVVATLDNSTAMRPSESCNFQGSSPSLSSAKVDSQSWNDLSTTESQERASYWLTSSQDSTRLIEGSTDGLDESNTPAFVDLANMLLAEHAASTQLPRYHLPSRQDMETYVSLYFTNFDSV